MAPGGRCVCLFLAVFKGKSMATFVLWDVVLWGSRFETNLHGVGRFDHGFANSCPSHLP